MLMLTWTFLPDLRASSDTVPLWVTRLKNIEKNDIYNEALFYAYVLIKPSH